MKINLAKSAGFCFGVKRAIDIALRSASSKKGLCMLGDIVHNEEVVRRISGAGIKKIGRLSCGKGRTLLIRAHGIPRAVLERAKNAGYDIIDATCPMVKEIHRIAGGLEAKGYKIIVIGDKKHDEVRGIIGQLKNKAMIIETLKDIPDAALRKIKDAAVVVQSTQNLDKVLEIVAQLKKKVKNLRFENTICRPTRIRQEEARKMPLENDVMVVIGSRQSANTKRLYEISGSLNKRSYWVESAGDLRKEWFKAAKTVGVTAGASTPDETTKSVIARIRKF